mmetsp:Transcript_41736/g.94789  ORF Transcript_41736/g.94789 Transcript_41736/m.94789 type:complete len:237 (+) Transcript_41736:341-1051(+)
MPSGMAATASVTEMRIMYSHVGLFRSWGSLVSRRRPTRNTRMHVPIARKPILMPRRWSDSCSGVWLPAVSGSNPKQVLFASPPSVSIPAILPTSVSMPVRMTMPRPDPLVTSHPEYAQFSGLSFSASPPWPLRFGTWAFFGTSSGSPVRGISLTLKSEATSNRTSAGTTSPTPSTTRSPGTIWSLLIGLIFPSLTMLASGAVIFDSFSRASFAEFSVTAAMPAFRMTMMKMAMPSM